MKHIIHLLWLPALLWLAACTPRYEAVEGDPTATRIYTLDNGLKVYMNVNRDKPRVDAHIAVRVGSKNDPAETTGLAHYFEHLMFKGTSHFGTMDYEAEKPMLDQIEQLFEVYRKTDDETARKALYHQIDSISYEASKLSIPNEYDKLMAAIGASGTNAYTNYDVTCYTENIPSNQLENWARIQADRFANSVIRGFHTELETIYEEYNMYAAMDNEKVIDATFESLFENHPYARPVIGYPGHLKNPSITNVKNYYAQWYVPNNMAICLSGDFDPAEALKLVKTYFGGLKPNPGLPVLEFEPEAPIEKHVVREVLGLESPSMLMAWRFPGAAHPDALMLSLLEGVLSNGKAGLIDLDVNQQQKCLGMAAGVYSLADYSLFLVEAEPKAGQSLGELSEMALAEIDKVKNGQFDESLLQAIVNNLKLRRMKTMENSRSMVSAYVNCFVNGQSWADYLSEPDRLSAITKDDLMAFARENFADNYVEIRKLEKKDPADTRIAKPQITPIFTNRDTASAFLREIQQTQVTPIQPVFVDFDKDMARLTAQSDIPVLYKQNVTNGLFNLYYRFETGRLADPTLPIVADYLDYLGTSDMSAEEIQTAFYRLACSYGFVCRGDEMYLTLSGLAENMTEAMALLEHLLADAQPDEEALSALVANTLLERRNEKLDQRSNASRLLYYGYYGKKNPQTDILSEKALKALTGSQLTDKIHNLLSYKHRILYYGPLSGEELLACLAAGHQVPETLAEVPEPTFYAYQTTRENKVLLAPYDANQLYLHSISCLDEPFDARTYPMVRLYNEYFGGGMNSIVFQEMREARGLAYSANARYVLPGDRREKMAYQAFIATQNDKLLDAMGAFADIIEQMPESEKAFAIAKESLLGNVRTSRTTKMNVLTAYLNAEKLGVDYDLNRLVFEQVPAYTLADVVAFQQENVKNRPYTHCILGRYQDFDLKALQQYGRIEKVRTEDIFGY